MAGGRAATALARWSGFQERHGYKMLAIVVVLLASMSISYARATAFWFDEIVAVEIARFHSVRNIWVILHEGADLMPPLNILLIHASTSALASTHVAARLPSMFGYLAFVILVFEMVRRRSNVTVALSAVLLSFSSVAFRYSYEARGYGLTLGFGGLALFAWSEAALGRHRRVFLPVLCFALVGACWAHYFGALLTAAPLAVGEATRIARSRKIDGGVLISCCVSLMAATPLASLIRAATTASGSFWRHASWGDVWETYRFLAGFLLARRFLLLWVMVGLVICSRFLSELRPLHHRHRLPAHEVAAGTMIALIPLFAVAFGVVMLRGAFTPRYAILGVLSYCLVLPLGVWAVGPRGTKPGLADMVLFLGLASNFAYSLFVLISHPPAFQDPIQLRPQLVKFLHESEPVVVTGRTYLECWYYLPPESRTNLVYVENRAEPSQFDVLHDVISHWLPVKVDEYANFVRRYPIFRMYVDEPEFGALAARLRVDGARLRSDGHEGNAAIYDVDTRH